MKKGRKIVFVLGLVGRVFVSIIIAKYNISPAMTMAALAKAKARKRKRESDLLTYIEFDYGALLAML